ncbi:MAG: Fic family protein [Candidatus Cyclonatronum sp.]|uniref:Fic family protein n=1 Tax=Cyclonatronum sp. TaxID=3024185 RepID=UPI0025B7F7DD|nr:Fic family protein [Cyclonatronum sp.]MCH8487756.1 Fic family protein [Cyclonatronum sp.]
MDRFRKIDALKSKLDAYRPLPPELVRNLRDDLNLRWTYHSNAIEGNTLTLKETKVALEGITVGGKTMREHLEAVNHREAIHFVEELVQNKEKLTEWHIKSVHQLVLRTIDDAHAGVYRKINVFIAGADHTPPDALHVPEEMKAFISWYREEATKLHAVERAARVHNDFVKMHPFTDGNGRTARLLMNLELMKSGYPPAILPIDKRLAYYEALDLAHTKEDFEPFLKLMIEIVEDGFRPFFHALGIRP